MISRPYADQPLVCLCRIPIVPPVHQPVTGQLRGLGPGGGVQETAGHVEGLLGVHRLGGPAQQLSRQRTVAVTVGLPALDGQLDLDDALDELAAVDVGSLVDQIHAALVAGVDDALQEPHRDRPPALLAQTPCAGNLLDNVAALGQPTGALQGVFRVQPQFRRRLDLGRRRHHRLGRWIAVRSRRRWWRRRLAKADDRTKMHAPDQQKRAKQARRPRATSGLAVREILHMCCHDKPPSHQRTCHAPTPADAPATRRADRKSIADTRRDLSLYELRTRRRQ